MSGPSPAWCGSCAATGSGSAARASRPSRRSAAARNGRRSSPPSPSGGRPSRRSGHPPRWWTPASARAPSRTTLCGWCPEMRERLTHVTVVTWATLVETVRRKDLYVVWILAVFGLVGGSVLASVGVRGVETFLRDIALTVVNFLSTAICIWLAARQMPEELSRRTLFPLLARPVRRLDVLLGKFLAVWLLASGALLV